MQIKLGGKKLISVLITQQEFQSTAKIGNTPSTKNVQTHNQYQKWTLTSCTISPDHCNISRILCEEVLETLSESCAQV